MLNLQEIKDLTIYFRSLMVKNNVYYWYSTTELKQNFCYCNYKSNSDQLSVDNKEVNCMSLGGMHTFKF